MDILKIPPRLIFKEREHLEDFGIGTNGTVGDQIFKCLKKRHWIPWANLLPDEDLGLFNEAYYLCAILIRIKNSLDFLRQWRAQRDLDSFSLYDDKSTKNTVLGLVYVYLGCLMRVVDSKKYGNNLYFARVNISSFLEEDHWFGLPRLFGYADPIRFLSLEVTGEIHASEIDLRKPDDPECNYIDWGKLTDGYKPDEVFQMISFLGLCYEDRLRFMDIIIKSAEIDCIHFKVNQDTLNQLSDMKEKISNELVYKDEDTFWDRYRAIIEGRALDSEDSQDISRDAAATGKDSSQGNHHVIGFPLSLVKGKDYGVELFEKLVHKGFIANDADVASWLYAMGFTADEPEVFKPIEWLKNVQLAAEMIRGALDDRIKTNGVPKRYADMVPKLFTKDGRFMKLSRWKKEESTDSDELEYIFSELSKKFVKPL